MLKVFKPKFKIGDYVSYKKEEGVWGVPMQGVVVGVDIGYMYTWYTFVDRFNKNEYVYKEQDLIWIPTTKEICDKCGAKINEKDR